MNPLSGLFTPAIRKALYALFGAATLFSGAVMAYDAAANVTQPSWIDGMNAVLVYVGAALGLTAASNVPTPDTDEPGGDEGGISIIEACVVAVAVVVVLWAFGVVPKS